MELIWFKAFLLTLLLEAGPYLLLARSGEPSLRRRLALFFFANMASHPLVWFVFPKLPLHPQLNLALSELWAFFSEALCYALLGCQISLRQALLISLAANLTSFLLGLLLVSYLL